METTTRDTDAPDPTSEQAGPKESLSRGRKLGISALIVLVLLGLFASAGPRSQLREGARDLARPFMLMTGLDQGWGVFAPSPPRTTNDVVARVERADGTVGVYPLEGGNGVAEYWDYRWRKYGEQLWKKRGAERERIAFAGWIADQDRAEGHTPTQVTLVRTVRPNLPPGEGPDTGPPQEVTFFTTPVGTR